MSLLDILNSAASNLEIENVYNALSDDVEQIVATHTIVRDINASVWMTEVVCIGRLVQKALIKGLLPDKAIADVAEQLEITKLSVRKNAKIYTSIIEPRLSAGENEFPLTDRAYYDIAVKHDQALGKTPNELLCIMENRFLELGKYSVMQAKEDLGLITDNSQKKIIRNLVGLADVDSAILEEVRPHLIDHFHEKIIQADQVLHGLLGSNDQES